MCPVVFMNHTQSSIVKFAVHFRNLIAEYCSLEQIYEFAPNCSPDPEAAAKRQKLCDNYPWICEYSNPLIFNDPKIDDINDNVLRARTHMNGGMSVKDLVKYAQMMSYNGDENWVFPKYDYGPEGNKKKYGQEDVPTWDVSSWKIDTALMAGTRDFIATLRDVGN